jgi:adenosylcobalamin-dependent ribonucleoside-triphosphate reductase
MSVHVPVRSYFPGMGEAVADRTVNRKIFTDTQIDALPLNFRLNPNDPNFIPWINAAVLSNFQVKLSEQAPFMKSLPETRSETWGEVAKRVAEGNTGLVHPDLMGNDEREVMQKHLSQASLLMSGRHLQHGDSNQKNRPMEVFTNCSTAAFSFLLFYLLLNGSGVGRAYDDAMMKVDWRKMPTTYVAISAAHPDRKKMQFDYAKGELVPMIGDEVETPEWFLNQFHAGNLAPIEKVTWFKVPDSRGGWTKAFEIMERMARQGREDEVLILDFSDVRPHGSPIRGMQNRPSSGPAPVMSALRRIAAVKLMGLEPWEATMHVDHYAAECVLVGGARRAARMATKTWRDASIFKFINIKREGVLWSSNNSVTIDDEFRDRCKKVGNFIRVVGQKSPDLLHEAGYIDATDVHAWKVLTDIAAASYFDKTGEPGIINQDRLTANNEGIEDYLDGMYAASKDFTVDDETLPLLREMAEAMLHLRYTMITNPCGEITLLMLGAYCVIADVVPHHAQNDDDAEEAFRVATRALIRTNTMDCLYSREVKRTNRIGVGITGFHEWAYSRFKFTWKDIVDEVKSLEMWLTLSRFKRAIVDEAERYSERLGVVVPHTNTTFKPAGTTSKLFGLTEGAHLPPKRWFLRWVQFRNDDPLVEEYAAKGYPIRRLTSYEGTTIVGFPTEPAICQMDGGDWIVTAGEATPEEQYEFLRLLEKYWIRGVAEDNITPLAESGNQVSYTLKYDPEVVDFESFLATLIDGQFSIRCCSVMPQIDATAYEYQPEEPITKDRYDELMAAITNDIKEDIGFEHVDCGAGACPIDFSQAA